MKKIESIKYDITELLESRLNFKEVVEIVKSMGYEFYDVAIAPFITIRLGDVSREKLEYREAFIREFCKRTDYCTSDINFHSGLSEKMFIYFFLNTLNKWLLDNEEFQGKTNIELLESSIFNIPEEQTFNFDRSKLSRALADAERVLKYSLTTDFIEEMREKEKSYLKPIEFDRTRL